VERAVGSWTAFNTVKKKFGHVPGESVVTTTFKGFGSGRVKEWS